MHESPSLPSRVCVLGMHRSGSSLVTELLCANGFHAGNRLIGGTPSNPDGHFEDRFLVQVSKRLLRYFGGTWDRPPTLPPTWLEDPRVRALCRRVQAYREHAMDPQTPFVFKDPRFCLLLPFYQQALGPLTYVVTLRNREDITRSILRRNQEWRRPSRLPWRFARAAWHTALGAYEPITPISHSEALALWDHYYGQLLASLHKQAVTLVHYEALLNSPQDASLHLLASLGLPPDQVDASVIRSDFNNGRQREPDSASLEIASRLREQNPE